MSVGIPERTRLEELSKELPEKERKEFLHRVTKRLEREEAEESVPVELHDDERKKIIEFEMTNAGRWDRFLMWFFTFLTGKPRTDVFMDIRLRHLKTHIRAASPGLTGFETRDLSVKFARRLYDVFLALQPVQGVYQTLASDAALTAGSR